MIDVNKWNNLGKYLRETKGVECPYCGSKERFPKGEVPKYVYCEGCYRKYLCEEVANEHRTFDVWNAGIR